MRPEAVALLLRKQRLQWTIAQQREQLLQGLEQVEALSAAASGRLQPLLAFGRGLRRRPLLAVLGVAALLLWKPRQGMRWLRRGWLAYLGYTQLREQLQRQLKRRQGF